LAIYVMRRRCRAVAGVDVVYHIAAIYRRAGVATATYRAVNATAVGTIIEAAARANVSVSSIAACRQH
jgi:hypothetical protein